MSMLVEVSGIIVKSIAVGEYDRLITILTLERGKISAFVRGARRQGSSFMGISSVFLYGNFKVYEQRKSYNLQSASILNYFPEITADMEKTCYGLYFAELAQYYTRENVVDADTPKLLYAALLALSKNKIRAVLVRCIFELRLLSENGDYEPCPKDIHYSTTEFTWNYIVTSPLTKLFSFSLREEIEQELVEIVEKLIRSKVGNAMKSLEMLNMICT